MVRNRVYKVSLLCFSVKCLMVISRIINKLLKICLMRKCEIYVFLVVQKENTLRNESGLRFLTKKMFLIIHQKKTRNFRNPVLGLRIFPSRGIKLLNKHKLENNSSMTLNCCEGSSNYDVIHIFRIFYRLSPCHVFKYCGFALRT